MADSNERLSPCPCRADSFGSVNCLESNPPDTYCKLEVCEHGTPLAKLCESCRAYLQSPAGQVELRAFGAAHGWVQRRDSLMADSKSSKLKFSGMTVKAEDCYDPADYVMVHKTHLARLQATQEVIVGEYDADGKVNLASSPLPEGTKLYARLPRNNA